MQTYDAKNGKPWAEIAAEVAGKYSPDAKWQLGPAESFSIFAATDRPDPSSNVVTGNDVFAGYRVNVIWEHPQGVMELTLSGEVLFVAENLSGTSV